VKPNRILLPEDINDIPKQARDAEFR